MLNQKGVTPTFILIGGIILLSLLFGSYYLESQNNLKTEETKTATASSEPSPSATSLQIKQTAQPKIVNPNVSPSSNVTTSSNGVLQDEDYSQGVIPAFQKSLPGDMPLYKNAKLWYFTHMRSCTFEETKNNDSACDVNSYIYHISNPNLSMDEVLNWYISNPANPNWIFGTPVLTEARSGKVVKGDINYIIRITHYGEHQGVQLTFEGPYKN